MTERIGHCSAAGEAGVERIGGVLKDHLHLSTPFSKGVSIELQNILIQKKNLASSGLNQSQDTSTDSGFTRSALADYAKGFPLCYRQINPINRMNKNSFSKQGASQHEMLDQIPNHKHLRFDRFLPSNRHTPRLIP
jgi:hypothetical protein